MSKTLLFPLCLLLGIWFFTDCRKATSSDTRVFEGKVVSIADGDTFTVLYGNAQVRIRLEGIDCPERGQPFSKQAKQAVSDLVFAKEVRVVEKNKDRYGRTVAKVFLPDGRCVNEEMIRLGMAWHFKRYSNDPKWDKLEKAARKARKGLWSEPNAVPPWEWRNNKGK